MKNSTYSTSSSLGHTLIRALILPALFLTVPQSGAQSLEKMNPYPQKLVRIVTGSAPGGPLDFSARLAAQKLSESFGQSVVVEPRTGASGTIATEYVAKAPADGYTLLLGSMATLCVVPHLYRKINYDSVKDFYPISMISAAGFIIVVHPSLPVKNLKQLIALAKAQPGKLSFGTAGAGSVTHLGIEMLKSMAKVSFLHIPYKGAAPAMIDLVGGQTQLMYDSILTSAPLIPSGKIRPIAVGSSKRSALLPEIPTIAEAGLPGFDASTWFGLLAPANTPVEIVMNINQGLIKTIQEKEVVKRLLSQGMEPILNSPEQFSQHIRRELPLWGKLIQEAHIQAE